LIAKATSRSPVRGFSARALENRFDLRFMLATKP
jgi:hypothetical protein